jgi:hypothetical protein
MSGTKMTVGSRAQVWHGTAKHTSGGLNKSQLMMNKSGRIVSRKKHASAKRDNRLVKAGYKTKKGHFGFVKVGSRRRGRKGHKGGNGMRSLSEQSFELVGAQSPENRALQAGGAIYGSDSIGANLSDAYNTSDMKSMMGDGIAGAGITNFGSGSIGAQMRAGMAGGRRRKGRRGRGRKSMGMYGGVGKQMPYLSPENVENRALGA